jgi:hypothetical protein
MRTFKMDGWKVLMGLTDLEVGRVHQIAVHSA